MLSRSRYSSEKSSLKRPRKFLIRFLSSSLPRAAMEVAILSNCPDGFTAGALETVVLLSTRLPIGVALSLSDGQAVDLCGKPPPRTSTAIRPDRMREFPLSPAPASDNVAA